MKAQKEAQKEQQKINKQLQAEAKLANKKPRKKPIQKASPKEVVVAEKSTQNDAEVVFAYERPRRQPNPTQKMRERFE